MTTHPVNLLKKKSFLFGLPLCLCVFTTTGCGALHMFEKSENEQQLETWKEEVGEDSIPDTAQRKQIRTAPDELVKNSPALQTDGQTALSRHGPPTEAEVEELRKNSTELSTGQRLKRSAKTVVDLPVFFLYGLLAPSGQP